ncbi:MAG: cytochrome c oxidase subunit II, partial [Acidobacteria bacterium]|nr:cytochrome c oxidase subunit II [Acidobacteriota bacterium]
AGRRREEPEAPSTPPAGIQIAVGATVALVVLALFAAGFSTWIDMETPPAHPYEITVTAQPSSWHFRYPNDHVDEALHLPAGRPVLLRLAARDAAFTFSVPAFRVRRGMFPGREGTLWFEATVPGTYEVVCARFAGDGTSEMVAPVVVHERGEFATWLKGVSDFLGTLPPAEAGRKLYQMKGCTQCHSLDGTRKTGPSFKGIFGHEVELADGSTAVVGPEYIRESILQPRAKVVKGFEPVMPPFAGRVSDREIEALAALIESLSGEPAVETEK